MQEQVCLRKVSNMIGLILWAGWHGFDLRIISNATDEFCKRLLVCVHAKGRLSEYLVLLQIIHMYILMYILC